MTFAAVSKKKRDDNGASAAGTNRICPSLPEGSSQCSSSEFASWNSSRWLKKLRTYTPTLQKGNLWIRICCFQSISNPRKPPPATPLGSTPLCWVLFQLGLTCYFPGDSVTLSLCQGISRWLTCLWTSNGQNLWKIDVTVTPHKKMIMNKWCPCEKGEPCFFFERNQQSFSNQPSICLGWYLCQVSIMYVFFHVPFLPHHGSWRFLPPRVCFQKQGFKYSKIYVMLN